MLRDFVVALSLSNLWFFNIWRLFLTTHSYAYPYYHWKANPAPILLGTMLAILLLSVILWLAATFARRQRKVFLLKIARLTFLILFYVALINILLRLFFSEQFRLLIDTVTRRPHLLFSSPLTQSLFLWLGILGLLIVFSLLVIMVHRLVFRRDKLVKIVTAILLVVSPFVLFTFGRAASQWLKFRSGAAFEENNATLLPPTPETRHRVVWIIFDEMDFRLSFPDRPASLQLQTLDDLRKEALFADNAYPPGGDTVLSLPSLTTGRLVSWSHRTAANELMLTFADNKETVPWSRQPNLFSKARALGFNTAIAGWFHPYCRVLGSSLTKCHWETYSGAFLPDETVANLVTRSKDVGLVTSMLGVSEAALFPDLLRALMESRLGTASRNYSRGNYENIHRQALGWVGDPNLQLIMIHYPIPHPPGIYDRSRREFSTNAGNDYLDNLALADRTLAELRHQIERAGLWESTTLIISSDHRLRADRIWRVSPVWREPFTKVDPVVFNSVPDERVPFVLKLAGKTKPLRYTPSFNTLVSHDLILAILKGDLNSATDVERWLNQNRSIGQSPYVEGEK